MSENKRTPNMILMQTVRAIETLIAQYKEDKDDPALDQRKQDEARGSWVAYLSIYDLLVNKQLPALEAAEQQDMQTMASGKVYSDSRAKLRRQVDELQATVMGQSELLDKQRIIIDQLLIERGGGNNTPIQ